MAFLPCGIVAHRWFILADNCGVLQEFLEYFKGSIRSLFVVKILFFFSCKTKANYILAQ
jgi:hypothetical protein